MSGTRRGEVSRKTKETDVAVRLDLDGTGAARIETGIGFFDHMLDSLARHARLDLSLVAKGDLQVDCHHTVEDTGIALGQAIDRALGDRRGVVRFASIRVPLDESLAAAAIDLSGRGLLVYRHEHDPAERVGEFPVDLAEEFFRALAHNARITLHLEVLYGRNPHHRVEALFKAFARALHAATRVDPGEPDVPSTKGSLA